MPPRILTDESTPNRQIRFAGNQIVVSFDEWVQLKDVYTQLIVSPPLPAGPEIKLKGKSVVIDLPDSLREETTYTLQFGNAIADLNEGNVLENFAFVFSTGERLDSATLGGLVIDAVTLKPAEGIWVMLYPFLEDSAVYVRKPEYISKTNKAGQWSIANIRPDAFRIVALKDLNLNYLFDQAAEWIGWLDDPVVTAGSATQLPDILISPREIPVRITEILHPGQGWLKLVMPGLQALPAMTFVPPIDDLTRVAEKDTLHLFYETARKYSGKVILGADTSQIRPPSDLPLTSRPLRISPLLGKLFPGLPVEILSDVPLATIDPGRVSLVLDTTGAFPFTLTRDTLNPRKMLLNASWKAPGTYALTLQKGAITDIWGRTSDSLGVRFNMPAFDAFGEMILLPDGLDTTRQYVIQIKSGETVIDRKILSGVRAARWRKKGLPPTKLTIEMIEDLNRNGRWDGGDYPTRRQPERRQIFTPDNLRAGWEVEVQLLWK